jgi:magnesium transporter
MDNQYKVTFLEKNRVEKNKGLAFGTSLGHGEVYKQEKNVVVAMIPWLFFDSENNLNIIENTVFIKNNLITCVSDNRNEKFLDFFKNSSVVEKNSDSYLVKIIEDAFSEISESQYILDNQIDEIEAYVLRGKTKKTMQKIFDAKKKLTKMRVVTKQYLRLIGSMSRKNKLLYELTLPLYEEVLHFDETNASQKEMLSNMVDAHLSNVSNKMNQIMKVLTIITTIAMPLTVISSIFGMNVDVPLRESNGAFGTIFVIMIALVLVMLFLFLKLGWLREKD